MLLNFTIQHLALQKYSGQSPIFNIGNRGNCVFKALSINKITSNFIYSNQKFQRLEILNSKFSHSLKSVVSLNRDDTINNTKFRDALALDQDTIVKNCVFDSCTSEAKGSAISSEGRRLTVDFCLFQGCEAVSNGGAIYIQSVGFLVKKVVLQIVQLLLLDKRFTTQMERISAKLIQLKIQYSTDALLSNIFEMQQHYFQ